ncbi:amino acid racemase [uncultured Oscillibacter sp.]|uniref:aspartate/glutamate racemase family protein n=1 Tax=uncultured Oscillibacter sp. TaxID=876091 RepID=UPI0025E9A405|nr:amino acid racemase [uncultured Oscillibacter sp.]
MKKTIGILGGMGPMATADLFQKITALTDAARDSDHIRVYIDSNASIPDRTAAILEGGEDPAPAMADALKNLELCGADCAVMPCNTAHYFLPRLEPLAKIPFLSMIEAAAKACRLRYPGKMAAILATAGTLAAGLYQDALAAEGVQFLVPEPEEREALMAVIYQGVKAGAPPERYRAAFLSVTEGMTRRGAECFLLACTELPVAVQELGLRLPCVDPTEELAKAAIRFCGYRVRGE